MMSLAYLYMKAFHLQQIDSAAYTKGSSDLFLIEKIFIIPISPSFSLRVRGGHE